MKTYLAIAAAALVGVSTANASSISTRDYTDYVGGGYAAGYYEFEEDGYTMTVTAGIYDDAADPNVQEGGNGVYPRIYSGAGMGASHDTDGEHTVDGWLAEVLILSFDKAVTLTDLVFNYINDYGVFDFFIDSDDDGTLDERVLIDSPLSGSYDSVSLSDLVSLDLLTGKLFGVGTSYTAEVCTWWWGGRCKDYSKVKSEWKLKYVKFEEPPEIPEVPLPAAFPLFLAGLAGFGFASRKKKA